MTLSIGVIFVSVEEKIQEVISYLATYQNTLQTSFSFRLIPCPTDDPLLNLLRQSPAPDHLQATALAHDFPERLKQFCTNEAEAYGLQVEPLDKIVLLTNTRFSDNYYYIGCPNWSIVALGGWQDEFAPPSIVEYYLNVLITSALDGLGAGIERHVLTRGCIFDFNANLGDKRLSVLSGYICPECSARIEGKGAKESISDALILLKRDWLGDSNSPSAIANTVKKLGFDLFHTTGAKPNLKERLLSSFEQEGLKNLLNFTFQLLLAIAIVIFGLKK